MCFVLCWGLAYIILFNPHRTLPGYIDPSDISSLQMNGGWEIKWFVWAHIGRAEPGLDCGADAKADVQSASPPLWYANSFIMKD